MAKIVSHLLVQDLSLENGMHNMLEIYIMRFLKIIKKPASRSFKWLETSRSLTDL